jgi:hypothetical protein
MREAIPVADRESLARQALLYAAGELRGDEAAAFEGRLGEDQYAREALAQAVLLARAVNGERPPTPDPDYRRHVARRLLPPRGLWQRLFPRWPARWWTWAERCRG